MKYFRQHHFAKIAWLAIWAMLLPVFVPLFHHPAAASARMSMAMFVAHCSVGGVKSHNEKAPDKNSSCPICQGLHILAQGFVAPPDVALIDGHDRIGSILRPDRPTIAGLDRRTLAWPRAPPFSA